MSTDPNKSLAPQPLSPTEKTHLTPFLESDLADLSLRELLGMLLSSAGLAERKVYLERTPQDKPNGFYDRSLQLGTIPLEVRVPRTRGGEFRPATLPPLYQRGYSQETQALLFSLLASARSLNAVKDALQKMGLSTSPQELEQVATELMAELDLRNSRRSMPTSWLCSWMASTWSFATKIVCARLASMWSSDFAATAKSKSLPAYHAPVAKISKTGSSCCATCWNAASVGFFSWCRTTFPDSSPLPKACSPTPTSSFVSCICNAMPKLISPSRMLPSSSSAGGLSSPPGTSRWRISSSNNSAIASPKTIPLSSPNYGRSACTTWRFLTIRKSFAVLCPPPMSLRPSTANWRSCGVIVVVTSTPKRR